MKYISAAALLLAMAACSNDEDFNSAYMNDPDAVRINATVGEGIPISRSNPIGTEEEQAKFNSGDLIGVAAGTQAAIKYKYDGTAWTPATTGEYLKWETTAMDFSAYYPVGDGISASTFTLPTDQSNLEKLTAADYMTYTAAGVAKADNVSLTLQRKTARVVINTSFNNQFETGYTVTAISVGSNATGYTGGVAAGDPVSVSSYKHTDNAFYALLIPTTFNVAANFMTITVTKDGDKTTHTLTVKGIPALEAGKSYTYNVKVGKDVVELGEVKVENWTNGGIITGGEAEPTVEVSPATNTVTLYKAGALTAEHITAALDGGTTLTVNGSLNADDMAKLTATTTLTGIDLRGVNYSGTSGTLGTVPSADWSKCTALTKILINTADATAYTTAWSAATDKLFYPGKELTYKVEAMTGDYAGGIPCVVIGITDFDNYRLISRNPYCGDTTNGTDDIYLLKGGKAGGLKYNAMTAVITPWGSKVATLADMEALVPLRPNSFTIITKEENGDQDINILSMLGGGFIVNSDGAQYLTNYTYDKETKVFTLGYQYNTPDGFTNTVCAFITFDVTPE